MSGPRSISEIPVYVYSSEYLDRVHQMLSEPYTIQDCSDWRQFENRVTAAGVGVVVGGDLNTPKIVSAALKLQEKVPHIRLIIVGELGSVDPKWFEILGMKHVVTPSQIDEKLRAAVDECLLGEGYFSELLQELSEGGLSSPVMRMFDLLLRTLPPFRSVRVLLSHCGYTRQGFDPYWKEFRQDRTDLTIKKVMDSVLWVLALRYRSVGRSWAEISRLLQVNRDVLMRISKDRLKRRLVEIRLNEAPSLSLGELETIRKWVVGGNF